MKTAEDLRQLLERIDHRGYPARRGPINFRDICYRLTMYRETLLQRLPS